MRSWDRFGKHQLHFLNRLQQSCIPNNTVCSVDRAVLRKMAEKQLVRYEDREGGIWWLTFKGAQVVESLSTRKRPKR